jgi:pyruvate/2-oxoglutarate dehydrogenase complex dihydrolipoamide dehydrogenase (E3) component
MTSTFDAIIIGTGQAGPPLANRLTASGMKVAVIERGRFGGTCVNTGCMPTKTMVASAYAARLAQRGPEYGVLYEHPPRIDLQVVKRRAVKVTSDASSGVQSWLRGMSGCSIVEGHARFEASNVVRVGEEARLSAPRIFINVGGRPMVPDIPGLDDIPFLTNSSMLRLETVPRHLLIIGGSYIGLEFGQMFRRFGAEVTIVERNERLVPREDIDVSEAIRDILVAEEIRVFTSAECIRLAKRGADISATLSSGGDQVELAASHVLLASGRRPNTDDLGLEAAGVALDSRGFIRVDDRLQSNVPGIWALGDCNGQGAFTHTAYNDFEIVAANLLDGDDRRVSSRIVGYAIYVDPPLGRVGMTEAQARDTGRRILVSHRSMTRVGRAIEKGETQGFMKILGDADTNQIVGAAILGTGADEAIHGIIDAMNARMTFAALQWSVPIHPTVSELIPTVIGDLRPSL